MDLKFSIITPSFNQGRFINETILSILSQNFRNFEHLVIDGGSNDETIEILKNYEHIKWISEPDSGPANALNKGFDMVSGDIIGWINADDYLDVDAFKEICKQFELNPEAEFVFGNLTFVDEDKNVKFIDTDSNMDFDYMVKEHINMKQPSTFFKRTLLERVGKIDELLRYSFDYELFLRMVSLTKPFYINKNIAFYRDHNATITRSNIRKQGKELFKVVRKYGAKLTDKTTKAIIKKIIFGKL